MLREGQTPRATHTVASVVFAVAAAIFYSSISGNFTMDDGYAIVANRDVTDATTLSEVFAHDFWGTPMSSTNSHKSYRPVTVLSFRADRMLSQQLRKYRPVATSGGKLEPYVFHGTNISLYALACACFVYAIDALCHHRLTDMQLYVAGTLFALHPLHTEAVCSLVGRAEILSSIFFFGAIVCYASHGSNFITRWLGCIACTVLSVLCKEQGITVLGVLVAFEVLRPRGEDSVEIIDRRGFRIVCLMVGAGVILFVRLGLVQGGESPVFVREKNPAARANGIAKVATYLLYATQVCMSVLYALIYRHSMQHAWLLVFPQTLTCEWDEKLLPNITGIWDVRLCGVIVILLAMLLWVAAAVGFRLALPRTGWEQQLAMAFVMAVVPFIPSSNLFFPVGFIVAERVLFLPSAGYCLLLAIVYGKYEGKSHVARRGATLAIVMVCCAYISRTRARIPDWFDNETLFRSSISVSPLNTQMHYNLAARLFLKDKFEESQDIAEKGLRTNLFSPQMHYIMGRLAIQSSTKQRQAQRNGLRAKARQFWSKCVKIDHRAGRGITRFGMLCATQLGELALEDGDSEEAKMQFGIVLSFDPAHPRAVAGSKQADLAS